MIVSKIFGNIHGVEMSFYLHHVSFIGLLLVRGSVKHHQKHVLIYGEIHQFSAILSSETEERIYFAPSTVASYRVNYACRF